MKGMGKILVIDDEEQIRDTIKECLEAKGYSVLQAENGVNGLRIANETELDVIVLDLMMPRMDGYMFMERLKQNLAQHAPPRPMPKILVVTAMNFSKDLGLSRSLGALEFIEKPFRQEKLLSKIEELVKA